MSFEVQGLDLVGIGGTYSAAAFNKVRLNILNSFTIRGLYITNNAVSPDDTVDITCDLARLWDASGETGGVAQNISVSVDFTTTGANALDAGSVGTDETWALWLIGKQSADNGLISTIAGLASSSYTSPSLPATYTHKRLIGFVSIDGAGDIRKFDQADHLYFYGEKQEIASTSGNHDDLTDVSVWVPSVCNQAFVWAWGDSPGSAEGVIYLYVEGQDRSDNAVAFADDDVDKGQETHLSGWMPCPGQNIGWKCYNSVATTALKVYVMGVVFPIWKEP